MRMMIKEGPLNDEERGAYRVSFLLLYSIFFITNMYEALCNFNNKRSEKRKKSRKKRKMKRFSCQFRIFVTERRRRQWAIYLTWGLKPRTGIYIHIPGRVCQLLWIHSAISRTNRRRDPDTDLFTLLTFSFVI